MRIYYSGGHFKIKTVAIRVLREREKSMLIHYSGGTHEHPRIPNLLKGMSVMLTFIDNIKRPEKVLLRIYKARRKRL